MSIANAVGAAAAGRASHSPNPWLIAVVVSVATFMEVLDTTIANVALPYIAGGMAVSPDEATWVVTTYLVSNAVILTASSHLAKALGRKPFFLVCLALFTASSILCGFAWDIRSLLFFRVLQGLGGGGMVPVSQSILADAFPPEKRGQGFALFGIAVVVAPVIGPTLGGWLSDNYSWHWCFLINGPIGLLSIAMVAFVLREPDDRPSAPPFDLVGFLLVSIFLGSLEVVLDRGQREDWFGSNFIVGFAILSAAAFAFMIPWEATRENPVVDIRMIATRQFGACFVVMMALGAVLIATTQILPQLLQLSFGYTATLAGLVLSPGGVVTMATMIVVGRLSSLVQPKYLIMAGAAIVALSIYNLTSLSGDVDFWYFARTRIYIGIGLPLIFIPITTASYQGLPPDKTDQASALINVARNVGGSVGVSLAQNVLARREQFHLNRLAENTIPSNIQFQEALRRATEHFLALGGTASEARRQAVIWIGRQMQTQASHLAYIDVFYALTLVAATIIPLAWFLRRVRLGASNSAPSH
ncbi:MAG: DHA2 family efflux MFS transporter permease subunit [Methylocystis sp.]|uniref:DHA2 family efflux MFS transporter permease subunit n=1 Tax=Methylocystis sp. TaxID=1911079 RepID=UPI003DA59907